MDENYEWTLRLDKDKGRISVWYDGEIVHSITGNSSFIVHVWNNRKKLKESCLTMNLTADGSVENSEEHHEKEEASRQDCQGDERVLSG